MERGIIVRGIGYGVAALLLSVVIAFLWVWFYSVAIAPGHEGAFYQAYAQRAAPICGLIAGVPLLFGAGCLMARGGRGLFAAIIPALTYIALDLPIMGLSGTWAPPLAIALSYATKLVAGWGGGWLAARRSEAQ